MAIDIKQQCRRLFDEVWSQGKLDVIDELVDPSYQGRDPLLGSLDRKGLKQLVIGYRAAFPDLKFTVDQVNLDGELAIVQWTAQGTHRAALMSLPATGKAAIVSGITCSQFKNGKVSREHTEWDALGLYRQLGVEAMTQVPTAPDAGVQARH